MTRSHAVSTRLVQLVVVLAAGTTSSVSLAQVPDNMTTVVNSFIGTGGASLGAMGYDPLTDTMYIAGFGASGELRRVENVNGTQTFTQMVSPTAWQLYELDGHPTWSGGQFVPGGLLLNPKPIYDLDGTTVLFPPYSFAIIIDQASTVTQQPEGIRRDDILKRIYRYNLQAVPPPPDLDPDNPPYHDGRDVFTTLVTKADVKAAIGLPPTDTTSDAVARQFAWSSDGQSIYFVEQNTTFGGVWKVDVRTGAIARIYQNTGEAPRIITEPTAVHTSVRDLDPNNPLEGDQILFRGTGDSGNVGGLDYIIDTGTSVHGPFPLLTQADIEKVIEWNGSRWPRTQTPEGTDPGVNPDQEPDITSMASTEDGTIYFYESTSRAILRLDPSGLIYAVSTWNQRDRFNAVFGSGSNIHTLRLQVRTAPYGDFTVPQLMYQAVGPRAVVGVYDFLLGDFDRDNDVDDDDLALFEAAACRPIRTFSSQSGSTLRFYEAPADTNGNELEKVDLAAWVDYQKFDLNGNGLVTARDRKILYRSLGRVVADFDNDGDVDQDDFGHFQACYTGPDVVQESCECINARLDDDLDVDEDDLAIFTACRSGPAIPANPACAD